MLPEKGMKTILRPKVIRILERLMGPFVDEGVITLKEEKVILSNLRHLARKGELIPAIEPRLINQKVAAEMLGLGHSNFRKLEAEGLFPFKRRMIHSAIRYKNTDIIEFILASDADPVE